MSQDDYKLGAPIRPEPKPPDDPLVYKPIPGRPGWYINCKGQMARQGDTSGVQVSTPWGIIYLP